MDLNDDELIVFTNYELKLYRAFSNFFWNNEFTDALLKCENKLVRVHKFLLSAKSSYFDKIFRQNSVDDCEVPIENVTFDILLVVLEYVYHGRVAIQQSQLSPFMEAANRFSIEIGSGQIDLISVNEQSNDSGGQNSPSSSCSDLYISSEDFLTAEEDNDDGEDYCDASSTSESSNLNKSTTVHIVNTNKQNAAEGAHGVVNRNAKVVEVSYSDFFEKIFQAQKKPWPMNNTQAKPTQTSAKGTKKVTKQNNTKNVPKQPDKKATEKEGKEKNKKKNREKKHQPK